MITKFVVTTLPDPQSEKYEIILKMIIQLMKHTDYDIGLKYHQVEEDFSKEYNKLCTFFGRKRKELNDKYPTD